MVVIFGSYHCDSKVQGLVNPTTFFRYKLCAIGRMRLDGCSLDYCFGIFSRDVRKGLYLAVDNNVEVLEIVGQALWEICQSVVVVTK